MYITLNSQFKPLTYDELVKPLQDYGEAYREVEEQYATLAQQTEAWKNIATQKNSPEAYAIYKKYSDELNAVIEDFSRGMTIQNRGKLTGLKSRYAFEITPIANAYNAMQEANAYRDTVKGKDDSIIFNVDRYNSLDDFLNGQTADNNYISGKNIQESVAKQTLMESYNRYNQLIAKGHSKRAAAKIVAQGDWIDEKKKDIVNNIKSSSGVTSEEATNKVKAYADTGIIQGVGTFSVNANESILEEEIARAKIYKDHSPEPKFDYDAALLAIYDAFGGAQTEEVSTTVDEVTDEETDYASSVSRTTKTTKNLTKERKLAIARQNKDMLYGAELQEGGIRLNEILSEYEKYKVDKAEGNTTAKSFREWVESQAK